MLNITIYNLATGSGFGTGTAMGEAVAIAPSSLIGARLALVGLFFLIAIIRKWLGEEINVDFDFMWSLILGLGVYVLLITFFGSIKIAFIGGLIAGLIGGYGLPYFFGGDGYD